MIPTDVKTLLDAVYGPRWGEAHIEWGLFDATGSLDPSTRRFGRAATASPPDDKAVFWTAGLLRPGTVRANRNVERMMVFVMDDVGFAPKSKIGPLDLLGLPEPTIMIESSPGNFQWQWGITDGMGEDEAAALRAGLPVRSDATAPSNLIRLPMGVSGKVGVAHKVTGSAPGPVYLWADFVAGCGGYKVTVMPLSRGSKEDLVEDPALLSGLVDMIPNPVADWDLFVNVGRAIWGASNGEASEVFEAWAAKCPDADPVVTQGRWDSYHDASIGRFWLLREATAADPEGAEAWLKREAAAVFSDDTGAPVPPVGDEPAMVEALQRDVANAIVALYGDRLRWNVSTSLWHRFDGVWKESPHKLGYRLAKKWADAAAPSLGKGSRAAVSKSAFYEGVEKILQSEPALAVVKGDFDSDNWLLGSPSGTVELRTGLLVPSRAADMISLSTSVAPAEGEDCPKWLKFVQWACTDPVTGKLHRGMLKTLQQWAGYCLCGDVSQEMVMFFWGTGSNGKGTFIETLQEVMGDYFYMATKDLFMEGKFGAHTEEIAALAGKRMVAADEVPTNARWNESLLKAVSGGGKMTSRHLYSRVFTFPIGFKLTIIGNDKPAFQGTINEALKRRLRMVEFANTAKPIDPGLKAALRAEAPGVLRWMINGLLDMLGGPGGGLFIADSVLASTDEYFNENDIFGQWLAERTEKTPGKNGPAGALFEDWENWRNQHGNNYSVHGLYNSHKKFKAEMLRRGKTWVEGRLGSVYNDLSIKVF